MSENIEPMLHGRGLRVARLAWLALAALALTTLAAGVPVRFEELRSVCTPGRCAEYQMSPAGARKLLDLGLSTTAYAAYYAAVELASASVFFATAAVVFWRRSAHWVALFVAFTLVALGATVQSSVAVLTQSASPWH
nr:hypothetical protein [Chloroflexia bacterium]